MERSRNVTQTSMASQSSNPIPASETERTEMEIEVEQSNSDLKPFFDENGKKQPFVWRHFTRNADASRVNCNYCRKLYKFDNRKHGLTNLGKHIKELKCMSYRLEKASEKRESQKCLVIETMASSNGIESKNIVLSKGAVVADQKTCRKALNVMTILDELPFSHVENPGFRHFCGVTLPKFNIPSKQTVTRDVLELHLNEKGKLIEYFKKKRQRFCLTINTWTSIQNINYMVITAHYIDDDWCLQKRILCSSVIPNNKGETITRMVELCLHDWQIDNVFTITRDNASANDMIITSLKQKLNEAENALVLGGEFMHLRCVAHILNLVVNDGLKEKNNAINAVRNCVKYVKSSPSRLAKFKIIAIEKEIDCKSLLQFDVPTRWSSTYLMLSAALKFRKVFERLYEEDAGFRYYFEQTDGDGSNRRDRPPSEEDWDTVSIFTDFLKKLYEITLKFSVSTAVTSICYFHEMCHLQLDLIRECKSISYPLLQRMAVEMKKKFDKYWGSLDTLNPLLVVAVVLDPRYKLGYLEFIYEKLFDESMINEMVTKVRRILERLHDWYTTVCRHDLDSYVGDSDSTNSSRKVSCREAWSMMVKRRRLNNEIDRYLNDDIEEGGDGFDLMCWWKPNANRYHVLSLIARDIFVMPVSTIASEAVFSTSGHVLDQYRSSLNPRTVEALICTQNWLKSNKMLIANDSASSSSFEITAEEMSLYDILELDVYGSVPTSLHSLSESVIVV